MLQPQRFHHGPSESIVYLCAVRWAKTLRWNDGSRFDKRADNCHVFTLSARTKTHKNKSRCQECHIEIPITSDSRQHKWLDFPLPAKRISVWRVYICAYTITHIFTRIQSITDEWWCPKYRYSCWWNVSTVISLIIKYKDSWNDR